MVNSIYFSKTNFHTLRVSLSLRS